MRDTQNKDKKSTVDATGKAEIIAGVSTLVAIVMTARSKLDSLLYRNLSALDLFEDMKVTRKAEADKVVKKVHSGQITSDQALGEFDKIIEFNEREAARRTREIGIKNIADRWQLMRAHQKREIAVTALATGGIALGSMFLVAKGLLPGQKEHGTTISQDAQLAASDIPNHEMAGVDSIQANEKAVNSEVSAA